MSAERTPTAPGSGQRSISDLPPLVVVEASAAAFADAVDELRAAGWMLAEGWSGRRGIVCCGVVAAAEDAAAALLAAVAGAGLLIHAQAERDVVDRLCEDLRRVGRLDHRIGEPPRRVRLTREEQGLVDVLLEGRSLGEAARELHIARRTADRRLASVREKLRVETTAEALVALGTDAPPYE